MKTEMNLKSDMRSIQVRAEDATKNVQTMSRKTMLTYLGMLGLAYDAGNSLLDGAAQFLAKAEKRGAEVEKGLSQYLRGLQDRVGSQAQDMRIEVEQRVDKLSQDIADTSKSVEQTVTRAVEQVTPGKSNGPIPDLGEIKIDVNVSETLPFSGYDDMKVQDILSGLTALGNDQLTRLREYEATHKNRSSILRELDARIQATIETPTTG
jgi:hypothetical protein